MLKLISKFYTCNSCINYEDKLFVVDTNLLVLHKIKLIGRIVEILTNNNFIVINIFFNLQIISLGIDCASL